MVKERVWQDPQGDKEGQRTYNAMSVGIGLWVKRGLCRWRVLIEGPSGGTLIEEVHGVTDVHSVALN